MADAAGPRILFVTGRLAEPALRRVLAELAPRMGFVPEVAVLPISVAALLTTRWVASHLRVPPGVDRVVLPGLCTGDLGELSIAVERGPQDLRDLPEYFGRADSSPPDLSQFSIEIIAEINHAPRLSRPEIQAIARRYAADGADVIDLGCDPGATWLGVADAVKALRDEGLRVSVDSFKADEIAPAVRAGAELVLSVNGQNLDAADWGCEVVAIPDDIPTLGGLGHTLERLDAKGVPFRVDPILEPIGLGFAASLGRYLAVRQRYPDVAMLMGVGNLTELTDVDSAGVNMLLAGFCEELRIGSVLTTEVANWCRSCVRELDVARRLAAFAVREQAPPKRVDDNLIVLRDAKLRRLGDEAIADLAAMVTDRNYRLLAEGGELHVINGSMHLRGNDPFELFRQLIAKDDKLTPDHAFYLGFELCQAAIAVALGKNYVQDRPLRWGHLDPPAVSKPDVPPGR